MKLSKRLKDELWANLIDEIKQLETDRELLEGFLDIWSSNSDLNLKECRLAMEKQVKEFKELFNCAPHQHKYILLDMHIAECECGHTKEYA
jgi:hypothetical protein